MTFSKTSDFEAQGYVAPGFEAVRALFAQSLESGAEWGAGLCVSYRGEVVVDLWGGQRDRARRLPWTSDTLSIGFSSTKGMTALCLLMLADRGELDYDANVADYWPEFGVGGKQEISVRTLLNHRAGLVGLDRPLPLSLLEQAPAEVDQLLAEQKPAWEPGTSQGYHAVTYGLYAQALFRRITGQTLGQFLREQVSEPLGADVYLGLPLELESRVAVNYPASGPERIFKFMPQMVRQSTEGRVIRQVLLGKDSALAFRHPTELGPSGLANFNTRRVHALELPWVNALMSARGLCRVYTALALGGSLDGVQLVKPQSLEPLLLRQSWSARDRVLQKPLGWSQGFLKEEEATFSASTESFGHPGAGGALGWCDPKHQLAIGYLPNRMAYHVRSPRARALCRAVYSCLR